MRSAHLIQPPLPLAKLPNRHADRLRRISLVFDSLPELPQQVLLDPNADKIRPQRTRMAEISC